MAFGISSSNQPIRRLRRCTGSGEDRPIVALEHLESVGEVAGMIRTWGDRQAKVAVQEG